MQSLDDAKEAANASVFIGCLIAIGALSVAGFITVLTLRSVTARIQHASATISESVCGLASNSQALENVAEDTSDKASDMTSAVSQMADNISNVSEAMDQMGGAIEEISQRSSEANTVASKAVNELSNHKDC